MSKREYEQPIFWIRVGMMIQKLLSDKVSDEFMKKLDLGEVKDLIKISLSELEKR